MPFVLSAPAIFLTQAAGEAPEIAAPPTTSTWLAAEANRASLASRPVFKDGPHATMAEDSRAAGEHGIVAVRGVLGIDGRLSEVYVERSSRAPRLDALALNVARASTFTPAGDAAGRPIASPITFPVEFSSAKTPGKGGGLLRYRCDQFVRDMDWWTATWPGKHDQIYTMRDGVLILGTLRGMNPGRVDQSRVAATNGAFSAKWDAALAACRTAPDRLMIDVWRPAEDGQLMRRLAQTG